MSTADLLLAHAGPLHAATIARFAPLRRASLRRVRRLALLGVLVLAAALRFTALDWGLRHPTHIDERVYVENVVKMVEAGDLDHRFYTYPGLFFYLLAPFVALLGSARIWTGDAYLVARGFVATCGVLDVALAYLAGSRLVGRAAGLCAALFVAVSPLDVRTAHQVRPDVLLLGLGFLALLQFRRLGERWREDLKAGLLIGLATAIKFTGVLMVPFYVAARLLQAGPRWRGLCVAGGLTLGVVAAATPYALIHANQYRKGPGAQLDMYYKARPEQAPSLAGQATGYAVAVSRALGPVGSVLFLAGLVLALRRDPRAWGPALLHPLTVLLVMSTATMMFPRLMLPGMAAVYLLAAWPVESLARRSAAGAVLLALLAAAPPLRGSLRYLNLLSHPSPTDRALDWLEAHEPAGTRVLETRLEGAEYGLEAGAMLGVNRGRHAFAAYTEGGPGLRALLPHADLVVTGGPRETPLAELLQPLYAAHANRSARNWLRLGRVLEDGPIELQLQRPRLRAVCTPVDLAGARISASANTEALAHLHDGSAASSWDTAAALRGSEWLRVELPVPISVGRLELSAAAPFGQDDPELGLRVSPDLAVWRDVPAFLARPSIAEQLLERRAGSPRPLGQALVLVPQVLRGLEIRQLGVRPEPWRIGELSVLACREESVAAPEPAS